VHDHRPDCRVCAGRLVEPPTPEEIEARRVMAVTAEQFGWTPEDLTGPSRRVGVAFARHVAMYLCRTRTPLSLPALGRLFDRHHTSVMHAVRKIADDVIGGRNPAKAAVTRVTAALDA
jgi:chromosomal replication initiation ATPase DnaA